MRNILKSSLLILLCFGQSVLGSQLLRAQLFYVKAGLGQKDICISVVEGDITKQKIDVIVNAANSQLAHGAGVCGAIFKAAGAQQLTSYIDEHFPNGCAVGQASKTPAFDLKQHTISWILHAVGPDCRIEAQNKNRKDLLRSVYCHCLEQAMQDKAVTSIAFPSISTGIYTYPLEEAAEIAINAIVDAVTKSNGAFSLQDIRIVLFNGQNNDQAIAAYKKAMQEVGEKTDGKPHRVILGNGYKDIAY